MMRFRSNAWRLAASGAIVVASQMAGIGQSALAAPGPNTDVLNYGLDAGQQRHSQLNQINRDTVKNLVPVWNLSLDNSANMSTQPMVKDGVMYVATHNSTVAISR